MTTAKRQLFPALRCRMGDTIYYVSYLTFRDVVDWIKPTDEIHRSKKLSDWIQRQLIKGHADAIAMYLLNQGERFFNALVIGIYGGEPTWAPLSVSAPPAADIKIDDEDREMLSSSVGLLHLQGDEKLFAIDGQHRVAGIKKAVETNTDISTDEIVAIFVGHKTNKAGEKRTRRLFTTLNKTARRVSDADRIALDEDDGFAVVTRRLIDEFKLFKLGKLIDFAPTAALKQTDEDHLTTIINIYSQIRDLYQPSMSGTDLVRSDFTNARPADDAIDAFYETCTKYWTLLEANVPELKEVFDGEQKPGHYRALKKNHLLFRPIGQRAFAGAVGAVVHRGKTLDKAIESLCKVDLWIHKKAWHGILWDPTQEVMLKSAPIAETFLLKQIGEDARSPSRAEKLKQILQAKT